MPRLLQRFNVEDLYEDLDNLKTFIPVNLKLGLTQAKKFSGEYEVKVTGIFSYDNLNAYLGWLVDVEKEFFPRFIKRAKEKKKFPIKREEKMPFNEKHFSAGFSFRKTFTTHQDTLKKLEKDLFTIISSHSFQNADEAYVSINFIPYPNYSNLKEFKVFDKKLKSTTLFGKLTSLENTNLKKLIEYYSDESILRVLHYWLRDTNAMVECLVEKGQPEQIRYEMEDREGNKIPLSFKTCEDVLEKVQGFTKTFRSGNKKTYHAGAFYGSVDKKGATYPSIWFSETDFGELLDRNTDWLYNAKAEQLILDIFRKYGIRAAVQFSGSGGFHNLCGLDFTSLPKPYSKLLEEINWKKEKREYTLYGFNTVATEVLGYLVSKDIENFFEKRIISIDPFRRVERIFKHLIDPSSNKRLGEWKLPTSRHLGSGLTCTRIEIKDYELPSFCYKYKDLAEYAEPENVKKHVRENELLYYFLPKNSISKIEKFVEENYRIFELMFWLRKKIERMQRRGLSYPRDRVLYLSQEAEEKAIKSLYKVNF